MHLHEVDGLVSLLVHGAQVRRGLSVPGLGQIGPPQIAVLVALAATPFVVWFAKRRIDRWEERQRREEARRCAVDVAVALAKSIQLCQDVRLAIQTADRLPDDTIEAAIDSLARSRQMLRLYLRRHIPLHELIPLAAAAEKRLGEGCQAMQALQAPQRASAPSATRPTPTSCKPSAPSCSRSSSACRACSPTSAAPSPRSTPAGRSRTRLAREADRLNGARRL